MKRINVRNMIIYAFAAFLLLLAYGLYLFNKPHRDISKTKGFEALTVKELLNAFSADPAKANTKYLSPDGNSKVLVIQGVVHSITSNLKKEKVVLLKNTGDKMGVACTMDEQDLSNFDQIKQGDTLMIKGMITSGNTYDENLDLYSNATLVHCRLINYKK